MADTSRKNPESCAGAVLRQTTSAFVLSPLHRATPLFGRSHLLSIKGHDTPVGRVFMLAANPESGANVKNRNHSGLETVLSTILGQRLALADGTLLSQLGTPSLLA